MSIDRNDLTNSELEEMGLPLDDLADDDYDFDPDFDIVAPSFDDEWVGGYPLIAPSWFDWYVG